MLAHLDNSSRTARECFEVFQLKVLGFGHLRRFFCFLNKRPLPRTIPCLHPVGLSCLSNYPAGRGVTSVRIHAGPPGTELSVRLLSLGRILSELRTPDVSWICCLLLGDDW